MDRAPIHVLYDGDCGFCAWSAARLRAWDRPGRFAIATIQASSALLAGVPAERRLDAMHTVDADGRVYTGAEAMTRVLRELRGGALPAAIGRRWPGSAERLYRAIARRRATLGRWLGVPSCATHPG
jgi:predicted DCC family thiol-disulfide oxidoreductase YuxK